MWTNQTLGYALIHAGFTKSEVRTLRHWLSHSTVGYRKKLLENVVMPAAIGQECFIELEGLDQPQIEMTTSKARALCYNLLFDKSPLVRCELAHNLGEIKSEGFMPLVGKLTSDLNPKVKQTAMITLGKINPELQSVIQLLNREFIGADPVVVEKAELLDLSSSLDSPSIVDAVRLATPTVEAGTGIIIGNDPSGGELVSRYDDGHRDGGGGDGPTSGSIRRYTEVRFQKRTEQPNEGILDFSLRLQPSASSAHAVDIRVPAEKSYATILVHASSTTFAIQQEIQKIKVPRGDNSEIATFLVRARCQADGVVNLLIYDEFNLIGSLEVRLKASEGPGGLELSEIGTETFRDPATAERAGRNGVLIQVSIKNDDEQRVEYNTLLEVERNGVRQPELAALGRSSEPFNAVHIQSALTTIRMDVDGIEEMLGGNQVLNDARRSEVLKTLRIKLEGNGRQIADELLSAEVRTLLASRREGSVVHWIISDRQLDGVPWELACDPVSGRPLTEQVVLVRVPVRKGETQDSNQRQRVSAIRRTATNENRLTYVLGAGVIKGDKLDAATHERLWSVVRSTAEKDYEVITNFSESSRNKVSLATLSDLVQGAKIVHLLCHGVIEQGTNQYYLQIDENLGRLRASDVSALGLEPGALIFVNACSSAAASFGVAGLTTFGWEFRKAGAAVYIGTLAPVTTDVAIRFAKEFFDAYVGGGICLTEAIFKARQAVAGKDDPTWMLYAVYGDLQIDEKQTS